MYNNKYKYTITKLTNTQLDAQNCEITYINRFDTLPWFLVLTLQTAQLNRPIHTRYCSVETPIFKLFQPMSRLCA